MSDSLRSIVLLGDSIFDNASYVVGFPCVTEQLRSLVPDDVGVSMLAVDGDYVRDVTVQIQHVPISTTHLFVSVGGNDALLHYQSLLSDFLGSEELFRHWAEVQQDFRRNYRIMLDDILAMNRQTAICTIYDGSPGLEPFAVTALLLFNGVIVSEAVKSQVPVIDLRCVCSEPDEYSTQSPIGPSHIGGRKSVRALKRVFDEHDSETGGCIIYR